MDQFAQELQVNLNLSNCKLIFIPIHNNFMDINIKLIRPLIDSYVARVTKAGLPGSQIMKDVSSAMDKYEKQFK